MFEEEYFDAEDPVLVIGAAGIDIVGRLQSEILSGTSNPAEIRMSFGGNARNVAENLARLGQSVNLLTVVGQDLIGEQLLKQTAEAGVSIEHILTIDQHPTGSYLALVRKGELEFALDDMRITAALTPDYIRANQQLFEQSCLLFVDANLPAETLETVFELAKASQLPVCADPSSTSLALKFEPYLEDIFLFTPNRYEASLFCDDPQGQTESERGLEFAKYLVTRGVEFAIVTQAEFGVSYATSETSGQIRAIKTEIVDPTGGGDALSAAIMFAILNGISTDEAIRLGVSAASLTLRHPGAAHPDLTLEKLYDQLVI
ncbi:MAG: carbohydrate kinase family protein [Anaerolineales bacterium]|nr:carbohydrate kinase family protein [Anaerolineales bacterium]